MVAEYLLPVKRDLFPVCWRDAHLEALILKKRVGLLRVSTSNGASQQRHLLSSPNPLARLNGAPPASLRALIPHKPLAWLLLLTFASISSCSCVKLALRAGGIQFRSAQSLSWNATTSTCTVIVRCQTYINIEKSIGGVIWMIYLLVFIFRRSSWAVVGAVYPFSPSFICPSPLATLESACFGVCIPWADCSRKKPNRELEALVYCYACTDV